MTIGQQLIQARDWLKAWADTRKGSVHIATDPYDMFNLLGAKPGGFRLVLMFHSEVKRGPYEESGFVDRVFWLGFSRGRGMKLTTDASLVEATSSGPPLYDLIEECRQRIRNLEYQNPDATPATETEQHIDFRSINPFQMNDYLMDAYNLEFSIGVQLPEPAATEQTTPSQP